MYAWSSRLGQELAVAELVNLGLINSINDAMIRGSPNGRSRAGHHKSGPALFMVVIVFSIVYKLWQWQT